MSSPSLLIEVLSPPSSDVDAARELTTCVRYGVPEYWIVDPAKRSIAAYADPIGERNSERRRASATSSRL